MTGMNYCATAFVSIEAWADSEVAAVVERGLYRQLVEAGCVTIGDTSWEEMTWFDPEDEPHRVMCAYRKGVRR